MSVQTETVDITVDFAPLLKQVYDYNEKLGNRLAEKALREGGKYLASNIRASAPKRTGQLRGAVRIAKSRIHTLRKTGEVGIYVGVRRRLNRATKMRLYRRLSRGQSIVDRSAFYAQFVENGTKFQRGQHFIANTYATHKERAAQIIVNALATGSQQILDRIK